MTRTDNLRHFHDRLRAGVAVLAHLEDLLQDRGEPEAKLAAYARVSDYLQDVVAPHLRAEVAVLYPEAKQVTGIDLHMVRWLIDSCDTLEGAIDRVLHDGARLRSGLCDNSVYRRHITALVRLLRRHLDAVENELLAHLEGELTDLDVDRIYERMEVVAFEEEGAGRVLAGPAAAAAEAQRLRNSQGLAAELFCLSEYDGDPELVERTVAATIEAGRLLRSAALDVRLSVDPAAIGLLTDTAAGHRNAERIARSVAEQPPGRLNLMMLDMEDLALVEPTVSLHRSLRAQDLPAGITLQARLRRTADDLGPLLLQPTAVRLVKGAFALGPEHDHQGGRTISAAYLALAARMLTREAREAGLRPVFATHDARLVRHIAAMARNAQWTADQYEFEMVVGVRLDLQRWLLGEGLSVRAYLPFGTARWPYASRAAGKHPAEAMHLGESRPVASPRWAEEAASFHAGQ